MSLSRWVVRRQRTRSSSDKPQIERIEHANLERPGARLHPRAAERSAPTTPPRMAAAASSLTAAWAHHARGPAPWPAA